MQNTIQNRKITLQNLLHKSEMFNQYLQNQQTLNTMISLNQTRKHQILQFGKCQINLPQKIKLLPQPRFNCNKLMVLTKSKKQAQKIKQKYDYLQKINESQAVNLSPQRNPHNEYPMSAKLIQTQKQDVKNSRLLTPQRSQTPKQKAFMSNPEFNQQISMELTFALQKQKQSRMFAKNRSSSAKVRPKQDLLNKQQNLYRHRRQSFQTRRSVDSNFIQVKNCQKPKTQVSFGQVTKQLLNQNRKNTQLQQKSDPNFDQSLNKQQTLIVADNLQTPVSFSAYYQKKPTSFSIKKQYIQSQTPTLLINKNFQQTQQQQKKNQIIFRKQLHKTYNRAFVPPPKISAKAYAIYELKKQGMKQTGKIIHAFNGKMAQQVASLTKIMTCLIVLQLAEKYSYDLSEEYVQVGKFQSSIQGTSAQIKCGEIYSVEQLLYGLMLPSGNDASLALGVWGGKVLSQSQIKCHTSRTHDNSQSSSPLFGQKKLTKRDYIQRFVEQMNEKAKSLQMTRTHYANTHGLVNPQNKSSAIDIVLLCEYAMSNQKFAKIVSTRSYVSQIKVNKKSIKSQNQFDPNPFQTHEISWQNTHLLLQRRPNEYIGIKTGVTTAAGPCLASCIYNKEKDRKFIIVVLGCKTTGMRFKQTQILKRWLFKQQNIPIKWKKLASRNKGESMKEDKSELQSQADEGQQSGDDEDMSCEENCED